MQGENNFKKYHKLWAASYDYILKRNSKLKLLSLASFMEQEKVWPINFTDFWRNLSQLIYSRSHFLFNKLDRIQLKFCRWSLLTKILSLNCKYIFWNWWWWHSQIDGFFILFNDIHIYLISAQRKILMHKAVVAGRNDLDSRDLQLKVFKFCQRMHRPIIRIINCEVQAFNFLILIPFI